MACWQNRSSRTLSRNCWNASWTVSVSGILFNCRGIAKSKAHALIIDDDPQNLEVLERLLSADGVAVTSVQDTGALEGTLSNLGHVDVVFLDLEMPKQDGYEIFVVVRNSLGDG